MIQIQAQYIQKAQQATTLEDLHELVQNAIELEHSTIPPYLTAMFSFKPNTGAEVQGIIRSVVIEEMLHMTIAANILNALGGKPVIDKKDFVPGYPGPLPMGIGSEQGLIVGLEAYSQDLMKNVFMEIEEPENPLILKASLAADVTYPTIGKFYEAIQSKINELADDKLPGDPKLQVTGVFPENVLFPILTKEDAVKAIGIIIDQGEGTSTSPIDAEGDIAHYYRFEELYRGKRLVPDKDAPHGYSFTGATIPFNPSDVYPLFANTKAQMLAPGTEERVLIDNFNTSYNSLLVGLHDVFNGNPGNLDNTIGLMFDIKLTAAKLCARPFPGKPGYNIGPSFEYISTIS